MFCRNCGYEKQEGTNFCCMCGQGFPATAQKGALKYCYECGVQNKEGTGSCDFCGRGFHKAGAVGYLGLHKGHRFSAPALLKPKFCTECGERYSEEDPQ